MNTLNENVALQVLTKFQCENPACQMERKQVAVFTQPLYLQLELNACSEYAKPSILELLVISQDANSKNFTPRRFLVLGESKHSLQSLKPKIGHDVDFVGLGENGKVITRVYEPKSKIRMR